MGNNIKLKLKKMLSKFFSHPIDTISLSHVVTVPMEYLKKKQVLVENRLTNVTTDAAKSATTKFSKFASVVEYYKNPEAYDTTLDPSEQLEDIPWDDDVPEIDDEITTMEVDDDG